tara:strand:+ start:399 stop:2411 length:2013 start_codon:yes stop_codon:yes gene_type:complete
MAESLQAQIARQQADRKREIMRLALADAFRKGMDRGDDQATIDSNLSRLKRILENQHKIPFSMANGGEARNAGIGPLSPIARDMNRGPKGIARFASGGEGIMRMPSEEELKARRDARNFIEKNVSIDDVPVKKEGILAVQNPEQANMMRQLGNLEYTADMQPFLDPIARHGFDPDEVNIDPKIINYDNPTSYRYALAGPSRTRFEGPDPSITITGEYMADKNAQAHEFRHRGLKMLLDDYTYNAPEYYQKYGAEKHARIGQLLNRIRKEEGSSGGGDYSRNVTEMITEFFEKPESFFQGARYQGQYNPERPESGEFEAVDLNFKNPMNQRILKFDSSEIGQPLTKKELEEIIDLTGLKIKKLTNEHTPEITMSRLETRNQPEFRTYLNTPVDEREPNEFFDSVIALSEHARDLNQQKRGFASGGEAEKSGYFTRLRDAVMMTESSGDPDAVSKLERGDDAIGLMQARISTAMKPGYGVDTVFDIAERMGFDVQTKDAATARRLLFDPEINMEFGSQYLQAMLNEFPVEEDALRAFNTGVGKMKKYIAGGRDLSTLTKQAIDYPVKVISALQGINPNEPREREAFNQAPTTASALMSQYDPATATSFMSNPQYYGGNLTPLNPMYAENTLLRPKSRPLALPEGRSLIEKYGLPGTMPKGGILNLANSAGPR